MNLYSPPLKIHALIKWLYGNQGGAEAEWRDSNELFNIQNQSPAEYLLCQREQENEMMELQEKCEGAPEKVSP